MAGRGTHAAPEPWTGRWVRRPVGWGIAILLPLVTVAMAVLHAPPGFQAWRGHGTWGVFTAEERRCTNGRSGLECRWYGTFVSDDGTVRLTGVRPGSDHAGALPGRTRVLMNDGRLNQAGSREWMFWAAWGLGGGIAEIFVLRALARRLRTPGPKRSG